MPISSKNFLENNNNLGKLLGDQRFDKLFKGNPNPVNESDAGQRYNSLFNKLEIYESQYVDLSSKLKPNSMILSELKNKIDTS